jgi:membrane peptidoglycan carboxypeptidase
MADLPFPKPQLPLGRARLAALLGTRLGSMVAVIVVLGIITSLVALPIVVPLAAAAKNNANRFGNVPPLPKIGNLAQRSEIVDSKGHLIGILQEQNREYVQLKSIPRVVRDAVVAIEDDRFYEHKGIDFRGIGRAAVADLRGGSFTQGGSTLTQQLVKNVVINDTSRTLDRKVKEAIYAVQLEKQLTKDQILELYLNQAAFGEGTYGVAAAAEHYFGGKSVSKLGLTEAAALAATIASPETFKPTEPAASKTRRDVVIDRMQQLGFITAPQAAAAKRAKLRVKRFKPPTQAQPLVDYIRNQLLNDPVYDKVLGKAGTTSRKNAVFQGGLRIITTLDPVKQQQAKQAVKDQMQDLPPAEPDAALASVVPNTGAVVALFGGRPGNHSQVNFALGKLGGSLGVRPGSAMKTFFVIAALEEGISPSLTMHAPPSFKKGTVPGCPGWGPANAEASEGGVFNMYTATAASVNTYFAQLAGKPGVKSKAVDVMRRLGISNAPAPTDSDYGNWAVCPEVLGAQAVSPLDMASAYSTLANNGIHCTPFTIDRITVAATGKQLYNHQPDCHQVLDPGTAAQTVDMLRSVVTSGTGRPVLSFMGGRPVAGKTGTDDNHTNAFFDGFTPQLATAIWVGFHNGETPMMSQCRPGGGEMFGACQPAHIFGEYMAAAMANQPVKGFPAPPQGPPQAPNQHQGTVPNVVGQPVQRAVKALHAAGYNRIQLKPVNANAPKGQVVAQSPPGGTQADPANTTVTLSVVNLGGGGGGGGGGGPPGTVPPIT